MPEYIAPGVYVEETPFRGKEIEGVSTSTAGFIGPTRYGPIELEPELITNLAEFERRYGEELQLQFSDNEGKPSEPMHNYMWHAARAFFEQGGKRLYIARTFRPRTVPLGLEDQILGKREPVFDDERKTTAWVDTGIAWALLPEHETDPRRRIEVAARWPGMAGEARVRLTPSLGENVLTTRDGKTAITALLDRDVVWIKDAAAGTDRPASSLEFPGLGGFFLAERGPIVGDRETWRFTDPERQTVYTLEDFDAPGSPARGYEMRVVTLAVTVFPRRPNAQPETWTDLPLDPGHTSADGQPDSVAARFRVDANRGAAEIPVLIAIGEAVGDGLAVLGLLDQPTLPLTDDPGRKVLQALADPSSPERERSFEIVLQGGHDGMRPSADDYRGPENASHGSKTGLGLFEDIEDISIVAAPGSTFGYEDAAYQHTAQTIIDHLISHAERMGYRFAILDSGNSQSISGVLAMRKRIDSKHAALYYPWLRVLDPVTSTEISLPSSGFVAGIYARTDAERGVHKAPANEVVHGAIGLEVAINQGQQDLLNPEGINCFLVLPGRGVLLWGARTISSDPEWKYVSVRRYMNYLERSIDRGTQWTVLEANGEALWATLRRTIEDFLLKEWRNGALLGTKPEQAYFVKCDRSSMSQADIDEGRLVCLLGVALLKPAEFVIVHLARWTADHKAGAPGENDMTTPRDRPYAQFNFVVDLGESRLAAGFHEVSGIGIEATVAEYRHGSARKKRRVAKVPRLRKPIHITLKRGVIDSLNLGSWLDQARKGDPGAWRTVQIHRQNAEHTAVVQTWKLLRARIIKHTSGPLNAKGTDVAMEELVLSCDGIEMD